VDAFTRAGALGRILGPFAAAVERAGARSPLDLVHEIRGLVAGLPMLNLPEQLVARYFVTHLLARLSLLERRSDVSAAYLALMASPFGGDEWFAAFAALVERLEAAFRNENDLGPGHCPLDVRVAKAVRYIEAHYEDSRLTLPQVAEQVGLSFTYLAHAIKLQTGDGFVAHLRRHRVAAARRLLEETVLSVKEIAGATGYRTTRQLERDFKRLHGKVPKAVRQREEPARAAM